MIDHFLRRGLVPLYPAHVDSVSFPSGRFSSLLFRISQRDKASVFNAAAIAALNEITKPRENAFSLRAAVKASIARVDARDSVEGGALLQGDGTVKAAIPGAVDNFGRQGIRVFRTG